MGRRGPHPVLDGGVEWRLRYGTPTRGDLLVAASYMSAYGALFGRSGREAGRIVERIRRADSRYRKIKKAEARRLERSAEDRAIRKLLDR